MGSAVRPWAGLRRARPGAGSTVVEEEEEEVVGRRAEEVACTACSSVGLFLSGSRLGLLRPGGERELKREWGT